MTLLRRDFRRPLVCELQYYQGMVCKPSTSCLRRLLALLALCVALAGCGGAGVPTTTGSTPIPIELPSLSQIKDLPRLTNPVVAGASSSESSPLKALAPTSWVNKGVYTQTEINDRTSRGESGFKGGMLLGTLSKSTFTSESSHTACTLSQEWHKTIVSAAISDMILCAAQAMSGASSLKVDNSAHVISVSLGSDAFPDKVRVRAKSEADSNGKDQIIELEMAACKKGTETFYLKETRKLSDNSFTYSSKTVNDTVQQKVTGTGTLNSSIKFTDKSITVTKNPLTNGEIVSWSDSTLDYVDLDTVTMTGTNKVVSKSGADTYFTKMNVFDYNASTDVSSYDIDDLAMGDGAANIVKGPSFLFTGIDGWQAKSPFKVDVTQEYVTDSAVTGATLPTAPTLAPTIAFSGDEVWSTCATDAVEETITLTTDQQTEVTKCLKYLVDGVSFNCNEVTSQTGEPISVKEIRYDDGTTTTLSLTKTSAQTLAANFSSLAFDFNRAADTGTATVAPASSSPTISLVRVSDGAQIPLQIDRWANSNTTVDLSMPVENGTLASGTQYRIKVSTGVKGANGTTLTTAIDILVQTP